MKLKTDMKKLQILAAALLLHLGCLAQQALFGGQMPLSPEIHADKTVTFRCMAPEAHKAQDISACWSRNLQEYILSYDE